ncbi:MAG: hypothetical protein ABIE22_03230 [archaeon]
MIKMSVYGDSRASWASKMNFNHRRLIGEERYPEAFNAEYLQFDLDVDGLPRPSYYTNDGSRVWKIKNPSVNGR